MQITRTDGTKTVEVFDDMEALKARLNKVLDDPMVRKVKLVIPGRRRIPPLAKFEEAAEALMKNDLTIKKIAVHRSLLQPRVPRGTEEMAEGEY